MAKIYVDSNAFIAAFEQHGDVSDRLKALFTRAPSGDVPLLTTSALTIAELLVKPLATGRSGLVALYSGWTQSSAYIDVSAVDHDVLMGAAAIRARDPTQKLPDAIHLSTARIAGCTHLLTNDRRMRPHFDIALIRLTEIDLAGLVAGLETDD